MRDTKITNDTSSVLMLGMLGLISPIVPVLLVVGSISGCSANQRSAVSPFYGQNDPSDTARRISLGDYSVVDDGDGVYTPDSPADRWVSAAGDPVEKTDAELVAFLDRLGIGAESLKAPVGIPVLNHYVTTFREQIEEIKRAEDDAAILAHYETIGEAAAAAGVAIGIDTPLMAQVMKAAGEKGCMLPLRMAVTPAVEGDRDGMFTLLGAAGMCVDELPVSDAEKKKVQTRMQEQQQSVVRMNLEARLEQIEAREAAAGDIERTVEMMKTIEKDAKQIGIFTELQVKAASIFLTCLDNAFEVARVRDDAMDALHKGDDTVLVGALGEVAKRLRDALPEMGSNSEVDDRLRNALDRSYMQAIGWLKNEEWTSETLSDLDTHLSALEKSARKWGILTPTLLGEMKAARVEACKTAIRLVEGEFTANHDAKSAQAKLAAIEKMAKTMKVAREIKARLDEVRRLVKAGSK